MPTQRYARPTTLDAALRLLGDGTWRVLAGGTDFYPAQGARPIRDDVLDINGLSELRGIARTDAGWRIGARTTWTDIVRADLPPAFDALKAAAREVGSVQIQNTGTVAGNLCNASPAADGVPPLMSLDAEVELRSADGCRAIPLGQFILGNRQTERLPGELVSAVVVPAQAGRGTSAFHKLGARRYLVISIAMVAARLVVDAGTIAACAIAVGSCSPVARRLALLETDLVGQPADASIAGRVEPKHLSVLTPIDDVRATSAYRVEAARECVARALVAALPGTVAERAA